MIFHSDKTIFFHPGKTAGTAIEHAFGYTDQTHHPADKNMDVFKGWDPEHHLWLQHATARFMKENVQADTWSSYFKFVTVRNPFDRLVSAYHFNFRSFSRQFGSFTDFILGLPETLQKEAYPSCRHFLPLYDYGFIRGDKVIDYYVRFEHIEDDLREAEEFVGRLLPLDRVNSRTGTQRPKQPAAAIYTQNMIDTMHSVYSDDFREFGYPMDPPSI